MWRFVHLRELGIERLLELSIVGVHVFKNWLPLCSELWHSRPRWSDMYALDAYNVTWLSDLLHIGQLFKACGNIKFAQIYHILRQFL